MRQIIRGNLIFTETFGELICINRGCLAVENGRIMSVGAEMPSGDGWDEASVTDYGDALILQAFSDMHLHGPQYPRAGIGMDYPLMEWLLVNAFPQEARYKDTEYARKVYRNLAQDLLDCGTTRVVMFSSLHADSTLVLMEELENAHIGGYVGKVNMDRGSTPELSETTEESEQETLRWLRECKRFKLIRPILTPRFTPSCTDELMAWLGHTAKEQGLYVQSHISENDGEMETVRSLHPDCEHYYETYEKFGLWKDHTVMAHCVHSDEAERRAMKDAGVLAVHCPDCNLNICSGMAPVRRMLDEGISVALGSDVSGGSSLPILKAMADAIHTSKMRKMVYGDKPLNAAEAYYLGTSSPQIYFGEKPGFAAGNVLNAVVFDDSVLHFTEELTLKQRLERLLYQGQSIRSAAVYANGVCALNRYENNK